MGTNSRVAKPRKKSSGVYTRFTAPVAAVTFEQRVMVVEMRPMLASLLDAITAQRAAVARARARRMSA